MSQKIDDVLEVLAVIRDGFRADVPGSVKHTRVQVINAIAEKRGVWRQTIRDTYRRRLEPDIEGTPAFDRVTESWLLRGSDTLRKVLETHALDHGDRSRIQSFFSQAAQL